MMDDKDNDDDTDRMYAVKKVKPLEKNKEKNKTKNNDDDTDRMNAVKKVKPLAPLRALTSNIVDPEYHVLDVELHLDIEAFVMIHGTNYNATH